MKNLKGTILGELKRAGNVWGSERHILSSKLQLAADLTTNCAALTLNLDADLWPISSNACR